MTTVQITQQVNTAIQRQLSYFNFLSNTNVQIPIAFTLGNKSNLYCFNVFKVNSIAQAEEVIFNIIHNKNFIDEVNNYDKELYLTVGVGLPL